MEGYECAVWCVTCWIDYSEKNIRQGRLKAKRGKNKQIQKMVKHSNKRIRLAEAGENVLIPIPTLYRRSPFDSQNLPGVILEIRDDGMHRIGTAAGVLDSMYMASQFQQSKSNFLRRRMFQTNRFHFGRQYSTHRLGNTGCSETVQGAVILTNKFSNQNKTF